MEMTKIEVTVLEKTIEVADTELRELNELQLTLIGGGGGEVIFG